MGASRTTTRISSEVRATLKRRRQRKYQVYPELSFYYGLSFEEIWDMPPAIRKIYHEALPRLVAQQTLREVQVSSFPHLKKSAQRSITRRLEREAKKSNDDVDLKVEQNVEKATRDLAEMQIGVQFVDKQGEQTEAPDHLHEAAEKEVTENARPR